MSTTPTLPGRSLKRGETTVAELRELTDSFVGAEPLLDDDMVADVAECEFDYLVVDGDLEIDGNFNPTHAGLCFLVVKGNLRVRGCYRDFDDPVTGVFVLGDLQAHDVVTRGELGVQGNLLVEQALVGDYNDYAAEVRGEVRARLFFREEHAFELARAPSVEHVLGVDPRYFLDGKPKKLAPVAGAALPRLLVPELLDAGGELDHRAFIDRLWKRLPVLR